MILNIHDLKVQRPVERPRRLQFDIPEQATPPRPKKPPSPIGEWETPPPCGSRDTPPILRRRVKTTRTSPRRAEGGQLPAVPSVQMEVIESVETIGSLGGMDEYQTAEAFGGRTSPGPLDTSPIRLDLERSFIDEETSGFKWMDQ